MSELLTAKQVQHLLSIDRTTIYRMLKDGRLQGIKVGNQWRFHSDEIEKMTTVPLGEDEASQISAGIFPLHCVQSIQNIFAQIAEVGAVTVDDDGEMLTEISNCSEFCDLIMASPEGRKACMASRQQLLAQSEDEPQFCKCHAGLHCVAAFIDVSGQSSAAIIAGQYYLEPPDEVEQAARVEYLASVYGLDRELLIDACQDIPVLDERKKVNLGLWINEVADTFTNLCHEKADMLKRMNIISEMCNLEKSVSIR